MRVMAQVRPVDPEDTSARPPMPGWQPWDESAGLAHELKHPRRRPSAPHLTRRLARRSYPARRDAGGGRDPSGAGAELSRAAARAASGVRCIRDAVGGSTPPTRGRTHRRPHDAGTTDPCGSPNDVSCRQSTGVSGPGRRRPAGRPPMPHWWIAASWGARQLSAECASPPTAWVKGSRRQDYTPNGPR